MKIRHLVNLGKTNPTCPEPVEGIKPNSNRKEEVKNGTFLAVRPTSIIELCERAETKFMMNCWL